MANKFSVRGSEKLRKIMGRTRGVFSSPKSEGARGFKSPSLPASRQRSTSFSGEPRSLRSRRPLGKTRSVFCMTSFIFPPISPPDSYPLCLVLGPPVPQPEITWCHAITNHCNKTMHANTLCHGAFGTWSGMELYPQLSGYRRVHTDGIQRVAGHTSHMR
jgi:hypothetical protein